MIYSTSIGLDVHARTICASALVHETGEIVRSSFGYDATSLSGRLTIELPKAEGASSLAISSPSSRGLSSK